MPICLANQGGYVLPMNFHQAITGVVSLLTILSTLSVKKIQIPS